MSNTGGGHRSIGLDQQAQLPTSEIELRKGGNVLPTSSPKAPAPNPFVQAQNHGSTPSKNAAQSGGGGSNK